MASEVEITAPVSSFRDRLGPRGSKSFTPYPKLQESNDKKEDREEEEILPFMARSHSPVRVKFTPSNLNKRKSRVTDTAKSAIFNYKPLRRKDNLIPLKFRAPDATSTTNLQYLSPWISITKTDFKDPRWNDSENSDCCSLKPAAGGQFPSSNTESVIELSQNESPAVSRAASSLRSEIVSHDRSRAASSKVDKRVKILDPIEMTDTNRSKVTAPCKPSKSKVMDVKEPECGVNYYSGYLPPEYSEKIAEKLNIGEKTDTSRTNSDEKPYRVNINSQFYKPLVGDRTLFKRDSYPVQPKLMTSNIYQIRLEDRKRLSDSHGQAPVHFSAFKDRGTLAVPREKGAVLDEAYRVQQRHSSSAHAGKASRLPGKFTSMEQFQLQRERTYHLQNLAREMINK